MKLFVALTFCLVASFVPSSGQEQADGWVDDELPLPDDVEATTRKAAKSRMEMLSNRLLNVELRNFSVSDPIDDMLELPAEFGENRFSLGIMERDYVELPKEISVAVKERGSLFMETERSMPDHTCVKIKVIYNNNFANAVPNPSQVVNEIVNEAQKVFNYNGLSTRVNLVMMGSPIHETSQDADNWECFRSGIHFLRSQPITSRIDSDPDKDVVDHYVFLTKDPNPYDDTTVGIAFRGSSCVAKGKSASYKVSMNEWEEDLGGISNSIKKTALTVAHEIGHGLGMKHDFEISNGQKVMRYDDQGQECTGQGGVMDYGYWTTINKWSSCSRDDFSSRVNSVGYCFSCPSGWTPPVVQTTTEPPKPQCTSFGPPPTCEEYKKKGFCSYKAIKFYCKSHCNTCSLNDDYYSTSKCLGYKRRGFCSQPAFKKMLCIKTCKN